MTEQAASKLADAIAQVACAAVSVQVDGDDPQLLQVATNSLAKVIEEAISGGRSAPP